MCWGLRGEGRIAVVRGRKEAKPRMGNSILSDLKFSDQQNKIVNDMNLVVGCSYYK
jgi:hypothetical protein